MTETAPISTASETPPEKVKLNLTVKVDQRSTCQRHVTVTIPREDIDRYLAEAFDELKVKAEVPGFRPGRAPRKLVESRFREQVSEQVKGSLLMDAMQQINEDESLSAISEPDLDLEAVVVPEEGPMSFEFNLEVRPDFELPEWKGLKLTRPAHTYTDEEVEHQLKRLIRRHADLVPHEGPAEAGDMLTVDIVFSKEGQPVSEVREQVVRVCPILSFHDATYEGFGALMTGAVAGDCKQFQLSVGQDTENEELRGAAIDAELTVLDVKRLEYPELKGAFLEQIGGFEDEDELRVAVREELERQMLYHQQREVRKQITDQLTATAEWDLPPDLLRRQYRRELDRFVLELKSAGFSDEVIRGHENQIRQNSISSTKRALKEHFILERIAEDQKIEAEEQDFDLEIERIAYQSDESSRRVRARLEKQDQMDAVRNQIIERKVIDLIASEAAVEETKFEPPKDDTQAIDHAIGGLVTQSNIPEAKHGGEAGELPAPVDHT